jgi:hypothetical protein
MSSFSISRYEQTGESLFICISAANTYLEHFFSTEEKADVKGTIERLVAELELKEEAYVPPTPVINKMDEVKDLVISTVNIATEKSAIIAEKVAIEQAKIDALEEPIEDIKPVEEK